MTTAPRSPDTCREIATLSSWRAHWLVTDALESLGEEEGNKVCRIKAALDPIHEGIAERELSLVDPHIYPMMLESIGDLPDNWLVPVRVTQEHQWLALARSCYEIGDGAPDRRDEGGMRDTLLRGPINEGLDLRECCRARLGGALRSCSLCVFESLDGTTQVCRDLEREFVRVGELRNGVPS
jgi:hypothetical protein